MKKRKLLILTLGFLLTVQLESCSSQSEKEFPYEKLDTESCDCFGDDPLIRYDYETDKCYYNDELFTGNICDADKYFVEEVAQYKEGILTILNKYEIEKGIEPWLSQYAEFKDGDRIKEIRFDWNEQIVQQIERHQDKDNKVSTEIHYWKNGNMKSKQEFDAEGKQIFGETYYYNGNIQSKYVSEKEESDYFSTTGEKVENNDDL